MTLFRRLKNLISPPTYAYERPSRPPAIVLAAFGTTKPQGLAAIENIEKRVQDVFPDYEVRLAFTSNQVRRIWRERGLDPTYPAEHPEVLPRYYQIGGVLSELALAQEAGGRLILVQALLMADGEEYQDLASLIAALKSVVTRQKSLHPFPYLGLGPPALGLLDGEMAALKKAALALKAYGEEAAQKGATMVFQAHGNHTLEFKVFPALEAELRGLYGPNIHIGLVEGRPGLAELKETFARRVPLGSKLVLAPLMVVAGEHAYNDLAGEGGWAGEFRRMGYNVEVNLFGLGENDQFADLYVSSLKRLEEAVLREKARVDGLANVA